MRFKKARPWIWGDKKPKYVLFRRGILEDNVRHKPYIHYKYLLAPAVPVEFITLNFVIKPPYPSNEKGQK